MGGSVSDPLIKADTWQLTLYIFSQYTLPISLRAMVSQFVLFIGIACVCFSGLLFTLWTLSQDQPEPRSMQSIAWLMTQIWFGNTSLSFRDASAFHPFFGPILMIVFAALSNTLLLTILISLLSNTVAGISENATQEYLFQFAIATIQGVKSDALFSYQPPFNIPAFFILKPATYILSPRALHSLNVFLIKLTSLPFLVAIGIYERYFAVGMRFAATGKEAANSFFHSLPRHIKHMPLVEALVGSSTNDIYDAIFELDMSELDPFDDHDTDDELPMLRSFHSRENLAAAHGTPTPRHRRRLASVSPRGSPVSPDSPRQKPLLSVQSDQALGSSTEAPLGASRSPLSILFGSRVPPGDGQAVVARAEATMRRVESMMEDIQSLPVQKLKEEMKDLQATQSLSLPLMPPSTPSGQPFVVPGIPHLSPSTSRPRSSFGSSFSLGPQHLIDSYLDANTSILSNPLDPNRSVLSSSPRSSPRRHRKAKESVSRQHPLANDTTDVFNETEVEDDEDHEWGMVDRMRLWRHDALMQHLYETAAFWGDKILSWTNDPNDAFWLAQTYFMTHQYSRAERLLTRPFSTTPPKRPSSPPAANGHLFSAKGKAREQDAPPPITTQPRLPMGPGAMVEVPEDMQEQVSRLVDMSVACRYLAAQCQMRQGNWDEATEILGEANPFRDSGRSGPAIPNLDGGIKVEASMCHLRGVLMLKLSRGDTAKECFMEALALDVKCYEAFEQLITGEMMTPDEEWDFVQGLEYKQQTPQDAEFVRLIYTCRLRKYKHASEHALTRQRLVDEYGLGDNPDVLYSFADALYANFRWADCFVITSRILGLVAIHNATMPLHIACMYHLSHLHSKLFILAHEMVEREPENAMSWYAVGVWYLSGCKWSQARQYFSKTSLMDPRFGPAWIAFAHTFGLEGEHDHAVTAYSTCARMFTGSHLPLMFVGVENIMLSNYALADEALNAARSMCDGDPLLVNEMGVMAYNHGEYQRASELFLKALELAQVTQSSQKAWATTYLNLGTCYRKLTRLPEAREMYQKVLHLDSRHSMALGFLGLVHHLMGELEKAIVKYHEALSIDPINSHILELLNIALEANLLVPPGIGTGRGVRRAYGPRYDTNE
ncbi:hypothetical protein H0H93_005930 [Arthromyces matolae]|nr:hypothetical protein H0H93_005930 [Arthromyces matolae]